VGLCQAAVYSFDSAVLTGCEAHHRDTAATCSRGSMMRINCPAINASHGSSWAEAGELPITNRPTSPRPAAHRPFCAFSFALTRRKGTRCVGRGGSCSMVGRKRWRRASSSLQTNISKNEKRRRLRRHSSFTLAAASSDYISSPEPEPSPEPSSVPRPVQKLKSSMQNSSWHEPHASDVGSAAHGARQFSIEQTTVSA
ncbi:MAG: hypothetical protein ACJA1R_001522, partial [Flavobacteriales bacterium]